MGEVVINSPACLMSISMPYSTPEASRRLRVTPRLPLEMVPVVAVMSLGYVPAVVSRAAMYHQG